MLLVRITALLCCLLLLNACQSKTADTFSSNSEIESSSSNSVSSDTTSTVPYFSQLDNQHRPHASCSLTSLAMVSSYFGITEATATSTVSDQLFERFGLLQTVPALQQGFNTLALEADSPMRAHSLQNGTITQLQAELDAGRPVIVHGWFTQPGHIVVVTGFEDGHYIVHDPYGQWNLEKWGSYDSAVSGAGIRYPQAAFEYAINDNGTGDDLWLHLFRNKQDLPAIGEQISQTAMLWQQQDFRVGLAEQCMNWTRTVLQAACGAHFAELQTQTPWDLHLLGPDDQLHPTHADSLASEEFGERIEQIDQLQAGDLVFLQNTYGNWAEGVITHVGIATGNGQYIHRVTSNEGVVKTEAIPAEDFQAGLRLKPELCQL
ncbi:C39 family peptidase [Alkalimonas collagenimarina]|uniref:C39 family peptidase n=1 Tax=Alkalimonas collagenimarina TaxID=400390 RepID=A0ABT9GZZ5_9GAMM|nr:C39 family peptidase [Alkalimonas collagenimarina]MDP4536628.1 C39 family peptidase [Alkalimonas collagenimarina]